MKLNTQIVNLISKLQVKAFRIIGIDFFQL